MLIPQLSQQLRFLYQRDTIKPELTLSHANSRTILPQHIIYGQHLCQAAKSLHVSFRILTSPAKATGSFHPTSYLQP